MDLLLTTGSTGICCKACKHRFVIFLSLQFSCLVLLTVERLYNVFLVLKAVCQWIRIRWPFVLFDSTRDFGVLGLWFKWRFFTTQCLILRRLGRFFPRRFFYLKWVFRRIWLVPLVITLSILLSIAAFTPADIIKNTSILYTFNIAYSIHELEQCLLLLTVKLFHVRVSLILFVVTHGL